MDRWRRGRSATAVVLVAALVCAALLDAWSDAGWFLDGPWQLLGSLAAGYLLGAWLGTLPALLLVAAAAAGLTAANQRHDPGAYPVADDLVFFLLLVGAPAVVGAVVTRRRVQVAELARLGRRLEEQRVADLEAARLEERQRIEVEVHRRLIERIGGLVLLAEGARSGPAPSATTAAFAEIEENARAALTELREAVGTLRTGPEPVDPDPVSLAAPPPEPPGGPDRADVALAAVVGLAMAIETVVRDTTRGPAWANVAAALLVAAPLAWRRSRPLAVLVACGLLVAGTSAVLTPLTSTVTTLGLLLVATYAAGAWSPRWPLGLVLAWAVSGGLVLATPAADRDVDGLLPTLVLATLSVLAGVVAAGASRRAATLRSSVATLEHARATERRTAVATTRLDLARGLHDSVAQAMTITCLQAAAARGEEVDPRAALATVLTVARDCMVELRAGLDELDGQDPGIDVAALRRFAADAGLDVTWQVDPTVETGPPAGAVLRLVVREGLTNVARHAPGSRAEVRIGRVGDRVEVEVLDDGSDQARFGLGSGTGLQGLREAVARRGGTLAAGPRAGGGFRVAAEVPLRQEVRA